MQRTAVRRNISALIVVAVLGTAFAQETTQTAPTAKPQGQRIFQLVLFKLGPAWVKDKPPMQQPGIQGHGAYMSRLIKEGTLILGGPLLEEGETLVPNGAMMILAAETPAAARRILDADPAQTLGLLQIIEIRPLVVTGASWQPPRTP